MFTDSYYSVMLVSALLWCLMNIIILRDIHAENHQFSGVYTPDLEGSGQAEDFAASFLISKSRFLRAKESINSATNMAGVSFSVVRQKTRCKNCVSIMARDYFDFMVEHLSTTSNQIPHSNDQIFRVYNLKMRQTARNLREIAERRQYVPDHRLNETVALIIYSSITFSRPQSVVQSKIRKAFFEATFWSIYRYIPNVMVFVGSQKDERIVETMDLPLFAVKRLDTQRDIKNRTILLPRYSLDYAIKNLKKPRPGWENFNYAYYTEGDQILHMREYKGLYDAIDNSGGGFVLVPHRMQTLPLAKSMKRGNLRDLFREAMHLNMETVQIVTENLENAHGSCCDNGRFKVEDCGEWWYQCPEWGMKQINPWIKFGPSGYTFAAGTAHRASCKYFAERQLCDIPDLCENRVPQRDEDGNYASVIDVCEEMPTYTYLGPPGGPPTAVPPT